MDVREVMKYLPMLAGLLAACSSSDGNEAVATCPAALLEKRASDAKAADIVVVGKWTAAEPDITPGIPIRVGTIRLTKSIRGSLIDGDMVVVLTRDIKDEAGRTLECGISEPSGEKSYMFHIAQNPRSLQLIAYR